MRQHGINLHLWVAAFFTPILLLIAISGGLYLVGVKGTTVDTAVELPADATLDPKSADLKSLLQNSDRFGAAQEHPN